MNAYISTRGQGGIRSFRDILLAGLAPDGGLYVPKDWPVLDMNSMTGLSYADLAYQVMKPFVGDDIPDHIFRDILTDTYTQQFVHSDVAPLHQIDENFWIMELFHGPTLAFKDYAMQV